MQKTKSTIALIAINLIVTIAFASLTTVAFAQLQLNEPNRGSQLPNSSPLSHPIYGDTNGQGGHPLASEPNKRSYWNPLPQWNMYAGYSGPNPRPSPWFGSTTSSTPRYNQSNVSYNPWSTAPETSHIRWIDQYNFGGVLNTEQQWSYGIRPSGRTQYGSTANAGVAFGGFMIMTMGSVVRCIDEWSGDVVWEQRLPSNAGTTPVWLRYSGSNPIVEYKAGNTFVAYTLRDGYFAGNTTFPKSVTHYFNHTLYGETYGAGDDVGIAVDGYYFYCYQWPGFDSTPYTPPTLLWGPVYSGGGATAIVYDNDYKPVIISANLQRGYLSGVDAITGEFLWDASITGNMESAAGGYGMWYQPMGDGSYWAYDVRTGAIKWVNNNVTASYWAEFHTLVGDGCVVNSNRDGNIYCFDAFTGDLKWSFFAGATPYEPWKSYWGSYGFHESPIGGGLEGDAGRGMIYVAVGDEGTAAFSSIPGSYMYAVDIQTGEVVWKYPNTQHTHPPDFMVFDGILYGPDSVTYQSIAWAKGPTKIDLSTTSSQIVNGGYTWITGRITDQSPAQPDTPCVSKDSMDAWMAYIHGGYAQPPAGLIKGVQVSLVAIDSANNVIDLGKVTSDSDGYFKLKFTPPNKEEIYVIAASFDEDDSYYSTYQVTNLAVDLAAGSTSATGSPVTVDTTMTTVTLAAIAVVGLIGAVNVAVLLKTRRNKRGNVK
jgi:outer membrane protein assembly factor BamB